MSAVTVDEMRVWVGCLACYNAGRLTGKWVDATEAGEETSASIHAELIEAGKMGYTQHYGPDVAVDRDGPHEELWCFDHEGFGDALRGECSPSEAQRIAEALDALESYHPVAAFVAYADHVGESVTEVDVSDFEEHFRGEWSSVADYAQQFAEETGAFSIHPDRYSDKVVDISDRWPFTYIDWEAAGRDMDVWTADAGGGEVFVFESY